MNYETSPVTQGGTDRAYKLCRCGECGRIETCTPYRDFYTLAGDEFGLLRCEDCFSRYIFSTSKANKP